LFIFSVNRKNGYEARKVIAHIFNDYPAMRPLIYVLKYYLRQRGLNEIYTGGLSSFLLFNLLYSYIQHVAKDNNFRNDNLISLGHLLVGFFQHYSFDFNYDTVGISIKHGGSYYKKSEKSWYIFY
jgi:non-canonical poly(A) RNA polymerase PAPD5/7